MKNLKTFLSLCLLGLALTQSTSTLAGPELRSFPNIHANQIEISLVSPRYLVVDFRGERYAFEILTSFEEGAVLEKILSPISESSLLDAIAWAAPTRTQVSRYELPQAALDPIEDYLKGIAKAGNAISLKDFRVVDDLINYKKAHPETVTAESYGLTRAISPADQVSNFIVLAFKLLLFECGRNFGILPPLVGAVALKVPTMTVMIFMIPALAWVALTEFRYIQMPRKVWETKLEADRGAVRVLFKSAISTAALGSVGVGCHLIARSLGLLP